MIEQLNAGDGLLLRQWDGGDRIALLDAFCDGELRRQAVEPVRTLPEALAWIAARQRHWAAGTAYSWAVTDPVGELLGSVAVGSVNRVHDTGWVSYWTLPRARGRGVASAACEAVTAWGFTELGLFRLELGHRLNNPASCRVAWHAGYRTEGIQRAKLRYDGTRYDVEMHARLVSDTGRDAA